MAGTDRSSIKTLITETVTMLLQNSVQYGCELSIQGLLGVTIDKSDVFIIHIDQRFAEKSRSGDLPSYSLNESPLEIPSSGTRGRQLPSMRRLVRPGSGVRHRGGIMRPGVESGRSARINEPTVAGHAAAVMALPNKCEIDFEDNPTSIAASELNNQDSKTDKTNVQVVRNSSGNCASVSSISADKCGFSRDDDVIECGMENFPDENNYGEQLHNNDQIEVQGDQQIFHPSQSMVQLQTHSGRFVESQQHVSAISNTAIDIPPNLQAIMQNAINQARFSANQCTPPAEVLESEDMVKKESGNVSGCSAWSSAEDLNHGSYDRVSSCVTAPYDADGNVRSLIGVESMMQANRKITAVKAEAAQWLTPEELAMQSTVQPALVPRLYSYQRLAGAMRSRNRAASTAAVVHRKPALRGDPSDWKMVPVVTFSCPICNRSFRHKPSLYRHQIDAHGRAKKKRGWRRNACDEQGFSQNFM